MISTLKDILYAMTSPEKYRDFMNYKMRKLFFYVFVLVFASGIITMGIPAAKFMAAGGYEVLLEEEIPNFTVSSESGLWLEEPIEIDEYNFLIKADSETVREDISDLNGQFGSYEYVIMADKEQVYVKAPGMQEITARFDEMPGFSLSKEKIIEYTPVMYVASLWVFVLALLMDYAYYFMVALVISWMAGVFTSFMRVRLSNKKIFQMAVYAGTTSYFLSLIQTLVGTYVPNFTFFSYVITLGYLYFAIKDYKENEMEELPPGQFGGREDNL